MATHEKYIEENLEKLGKRLQELRIKKGYKNYEQFAFQNDISRSQYGRYENGQDLRFSTLCKVLKALDISFEEFFKGFNEC
tara:strand:- start:372833 stop:373075 length:243 start_codon:yes stop_codon:yes gene_type:complete